MRQVVPAGEVGRDTVEGLARDFSQVLLLLHPVYGAWQLYELPKGSDWDGERLRAAIVANHASRGEEARWWESRGAPRIFEEALTLWPGPWLLEFLREKDLWRTGGAKDFVRHHEEREGKRRVAEARSRHDLHRGIADDVRREVRDQLRGDTIRRKWVISKEREFNG